MIVNLCIALGVVFAALLIFAAGVRLGFTRGMRARLAGVIPPSVARSRQQTREFAKGVAKGMRAAHRDEINELKAVANGPRWRQLLHRALFPVLLLVAASIGAGCAQLTGVKPDAKACKRDYDVHVAVQLDTLRDSTLRVRVGACT